jgi:DNA-binding NtrC family response regulator
MTIALFATDQTALSAIVDALGREGVSLSTFVISSSLSRNDIDVSIAASVLIANASGTGDVVAWVKQVRELVGNNSPLILCAPQSAASDRRALKECGASEIITPQSWSVEHVFERVLSQIILGRWVTAHKFGGLYGATSKVRQLFSDIERLAPLSEPILILGETGTGKELVARELHVRSKRQDSYIPINCPEVQPELISSELFGHEAGAFTGANKSRVGLIAAAGGGTVFLDEIGDLDLRSQAKLLRVLEDRKVRRIGANQLEDVPARIVMATSRDLWKACAEGWFRQDLYERIRGFKLELPPLRERKADIPILAEHFIDEYNEEYKTNCRMPAGGADCLFQYDWPGNVRELRAVIRKAAVYSAAGYISSTIMHESVRRPQIEITQSVVPFDPSTDTWRDLINRAQTIYFQALLTRTNGNKEAAAKLSGLSRSQFFEKLKETSKET